METYDNFLDTSKKIKELEDKNIELDNRIKLLEGEN